VAGAVVLVAAARLLRHALVIAAIGLLLAVPRPAGAAPAAHARVVTIMLDPGHNLYPNLGYEPIGPGSSTFKIKDGGGTHGVVTGQSEASVNLRIAFRLRALLRADGLHVIMTRHKTCCRSKGNVARARLANRAHAALFLRIHADGSTNHAVRGTSMLYPALHARWTDDIFGRSRQAARLVQSRLVRRLGWPNRGLVARGDLTGFNWANVPAILTEVGFLTNPSEDRALATHRTVKRIARGLEGGVLAYLRARSLR
jgi:N-acetylmuramoyl-L-alanine amidase